MAKSKRNGETLRDTRPEAPVPDRTGGHGQLEHTSPTPGGTADAISGRMPEDPLRETNRGADEEASVAQTGGTRSHAGRKRNEVL